MSYISKLCGNTPTFWFDSIGSKFPSNFNYFCLRAQPAFIGSLIPSLIYLIIRIMHGSIISALVAAAMMLFETSIIVESRIIATDAFLFFFISLSIFFGKSQTLQKYPSFSFYLFMFLTAFSLGFSLATKLTSVATVFAIAILQLLDLYKRHFSKKTNYKLLIKDITIRILIFIITILVIYLTAFFFHFNLLPFESRDDEYIPFEYKPKDLIQKNTFENQLQSSKKFRPFYFLYKVWKVNKDMYKANMAINEKHSYSSPWYSWPLHFGKPVLYWIKYDSTNISKIESIYCIGNIIVWWLVFTGVVVYVFMLIIFHFILRRHKKKIEKKILDHSQKITKIKNEVFYHKFDYLQDNLLLHFDSLCFLLAGYLFNLFIFFPISRPTWLYHYIPSLIFGILLFSLLLDILIRVYFPDLIWKFLIVSILIFWTFLSFVFFIPFIYAFPLNPFQFNERIFFSFWKPKKI
ncbi:dolichyl-phosphate-mannose--protein mannosyltransferase [Anaeramoeba ignava]|uniref:Dolichyl-phosphate-mannose--protein mannosyltransferase n=1 Tax=Anaeramoeba ignava TaxID=1746090 RepID=A0A9Q0RCZ5_ANAIG|nr:dolichyl-phosphate-mannose--protein mannosyltransferase [Anaeramoeba ignava]